MRVESFSLARSKGFSLIEVLVTMIILLVGLLGLIGLQGKALTAQMEAYQRSQALVWLYDMAGRLEGNRKNAASYKTTGVGTGHNSSALLTGCPAKATRAEVDLCEWHNALLGASERDSSNNPSITVVGARGCVYEISATDPKQYLVVVAWQGLSPTAAPSNDCGKNQYGDDKLRRTVSVPITVGVTGS